MANIGDFFGTDSLLSEEERAVRDTIADWVGERLLPIIGKSYTEARFPTDYCFFKFTQNFVN